MNLSQSSRADAARQPLRLPVCLPQPPSKGWDLHCHTIYSDGTLTPYDLVHQAQQAGLLGVAITDHDTTSGWEDAAAAARELHMPLLRGTEITAEYETCCVHMLAYLYDPHNARITALFAATRHARLVRAQRMVERLARDYPITWDDVLRQIKRGDATTVGRPHIADALVAAGVYERRSQAFAGVLRPQSPYYVPTPSPSVHEVLQAIQEAGGVSVIAHAGDVRRSPHILTDEQLLHLADEGLDGIEVWHRGNDTSQRQRLYAVARERGMLVTGGSDWHGAGKPNVLGENLTAPDVVDAIIARGTLDVVR